MHRRLRLPAILLAGALAAGGSILGAATANAAPGDQTPYTDPDSATQGAQYTRAITLRHNGAANGTVLGSFERFVATDGDKPSFPIYRSTNFGQSWQFVTNINDVFGVGNKWQPSLYELPAASGNLAEGTILLAGNSVPNDISSTRLVLYKSTDAGQTWSFVSTIDRGGPGVYDPGPNSTTTAIWEPELQLTPSGLVVYYSDERQKSAGILQGIVERVSSDGGRTWGALKNVAAVPNRNDRAGMASVLQLPNGKYFIVYEDVNGPGGGVPVYGKFSDDGVNWGDSTNLGTRLTTAAGQWMNGSPTAEWVPTGGPKGTLIVTGGGTSGTNTEFANFLANTNYGVGDWSLFPSPVDQTGVGYAESVTPSLDNRYLMQFTSVPIGNGKDKVVSSVMPLDTVKYEAEGQVLTPDVQILPRTSASAGAEVGYINQASSSVTFNKITAPRAGDYKIRVRYSNGSGATATHQVSVNGAAASTLSYPVTRDWDAYDYVTFTARLKSGTNTIKFSKGDNFAELDVIEQYTQGTRYEAEAATLTNDQKVARLTASGGQNVGFINDPTSSVSFTSVSAEAAGTYAIRVTYSNGSGATATHSMSVNGVTQTVSYPATGGYDQEGSVTVLAALKAGSNTVTFTKGTGFTELDAIDVY